MAFSTLNDDQRKGLTGFVSIAAKASKSPKLTLLLNNKAYGKIFGNLNDLTDLPFTQQSFIEAAMMLPTLRNAHFFLIAMEGAGQDAVASLTQALGTHCWLQVAQQVNANLTPDRQFSDTDLHYASAPTDSASCTLDPSGLAKVLIPIIGAGMATEKFFAGTLPDFFEGSFSDFFTGTMSDFFTQDVAGFFTDDVGGAFKSGYGTVAGGVVSGYGTVVSGLESGWRSFTGLFG